MNERDIYREYTQAEMDAQFDNRSRVPEHVDIHAAFEAEAVLSE